MVLAGNKSVSSKLDWDSYIISVDKTTSISEPWFVRLFLLRLLCNSINLPCGLAWNTVAVSWLVFLAATWKCWINFKNGYVRLLVIHLLPLLNPWFIAEF